MIFLILLLVVIVLLLIPAVLPKEYTVVQDIVIDKPKNEVFAYIKYLKNQDNFSKWILLDPQVKKEYKGEDATVGFISSWDSQNKKVGKGEQEIKNIIDGEKIIYEIRFFAPFKSTSPAYMAVESVDENKTKVIWGFEGKMSYPMNVMIASFTPGLKADLHTGLINLKSLLEK